jgi:hypothetical protein
MGRLLMYGMMSMMHGATQKHDRPTAGGAHDASSAFSPLGLVMSNRVVAGVSLAKL